MGASAHHPEPHGTRGPDALARLIDELHELGFERSPTPHRPGHVVYTATDSPVTFIVATDPPDPHVQVRGSREADAWQLAFTAQTPDTVVLIAVYAVLNDDPATALHAARSALTAGPATDHCARPYPPAG
jgi:hypothetical protein